MLGKLNSKFPQKTNESGANYGHEEGMTFSLTLAPPYLLLHLSTNAPP